MNLREIAMVAGVSPASISLVLHGKAGVGAEKRAQISRLLHENGYNVASDRLASKRISFLKYVTDANAIDGNPGFVTAIMDAAELECRNNGYILSVATFNSIPEIMDFIHMQEPDGIIVLGTEINEADMHEFKALRTPYIVVDNLLSLTPCHAITMDNYASIFQCVKHLAELGHKKIGFLRTRSYHSSNCEVRMRSFIEALRYYDIPYDPTLVYEMMNCTLNGSYVSMCKLLKSGIRLPSALVSSCDVSALGALKALQEFGIRVPQDVSITGFDDISFAEISNPPLTTVKVPCAEIGVWTVRILQQLISAPDTPPLKLQLSTTFTVRESTGPYLGS